jgi:hypothetical protein
MFGQSRNAPLSTFSAKINVAFALGIFGKETKKQLDRVRNVRNHFAHLKDKVTFEDVEVRDECMKFTQPRYLPSKLKEARAKTLTPKLMYVQTCIFSDVDLGNYALLKNTKGQKGLSMEIF